MANVLFTRKNASEIPNVPITDGQLIFDTSGNGKMYLDNGTRRLEMGGALTVDATLSKTSTNPVQNKAVAGVMLDTLSDISNVTSKGFLADALTVKELNNNLSNINVYVGEDEKLHFVDSTGADSALPFSYGFKNVTITRTYGHVPVTSGKYYIVAASRDGQPQELTAGANILWSDGYSDGYSTCFIALIQATASELLFTNNNNPIILVQLNVL